MEKWFGTLTLENLEEVAAMIGDLLDGKRYTFVACNEYFKFKPEVRTGQELNHKGSANGRAINAWLDDEETPPRFGGFNIGDTYGVWGCTTNVNAEGHHYDPTFNAPYLSFDWGKVTITHRAPAGHLLYWVAAVEAD